MLFNNAIGIAICKQHATSRELPCAVRSIERRHVISEELFHDALVRERKRADRFEEAFVLVLISLDRRRLDPPARGAACRGAVAIATGRRRDWMVRAGFGARSHSLARRPRVRRDAPATLANAFRRELARCLPPTGAAAARFAAKSTPHAATPSRRSSSTRAIGADSRGRWRERRPSGRWISPAAPRSRSPSRPCSCSWPLLVKLTSTGPVFFRQQRVGEAGRPFTMLKFRTMHVNADHRIHQQYVEKFIQSSQPADVRQERRCSRS